MSQFDACVGVRKVPVYFGMSVVPTVLPGGDMSVHRLHVGDKAVQTLTAQGAELDLCHVKPTAMLRRVMYFETLRETPRLFRRKRLIERSRRMGVQVVQDKAYSFGVRIPVVQHTFDPPCPVFPCPTLAGRHVAFAGKGFHFKKDLSHTIAHVLMIHSGRSARRTGYTIIHVADKLFAGFIHAYHRIAPVIRQFVDSKNIFHTGYEGSVLLRWDFPVLPEVRLKFVFLSMRCTVMCDTLGVRLSSVAFSASSRSVQRRRPSGASEQAIEMSRASKAPSKVTSRGGFSGCLRSSSAAATPSSTNRYFRCSMVRGVTPIASAVCATVQAGPSLPASQRSKARA